MSVPLRLRRMITRMHNQISAGVRTPVEALVDLHQALGDHLHGLRAHPRPHPIKVDFIVDADGTVMCALCGCAIEPSAVNEHRCGRPES